MPTAGLRAGFRERSRVKKVVQAGFRFEPCERRLVLSAQLLFDVLGDQPLDLHGSLNSTSPLNPSCDPWSRASEQSHAETLSELHQVEPQLKEAHLATGWNEVQQQYGLTGKGQTVAVIDSGIAWDHVALGEGYGPGYRVVGGWDFTEENDAVPYDDAPAGFHGTHVSGIVGSSDPNHPGVAPAVDLVALRVFNDMGQGQLSWVETALQWVHDNQHAFENPITTVNLSLGTSWNADAIPAWATLEEELQALFNDGIVVTASAGNSFQDYLASGLSYPAASSYVLPVASVDEDGGLSDFSQRNSQVIAAPGSRIVSSVPDHVLGRDGRVDDYTAASGTSMSAPYVAGASVLVRQAMEMVGLQNVNLTAIADHLHATADSVYDAVTQTNYDALNLAQAIESLIPTDSVGNSLVTAAPLSLTSSSFEGWINTLQDTDLYRFTPSSSGVLRLDANSEWLDSLSWVLRAGATEIAHGALEQADIPLVAGQSYEILVSANQEIGPFSFDWSLSGAEIGGADGSNGEDNSRGGTPSTGVPVNDLGAVRYREETLSAGGTYRAQAVADGVFTVQWTGPETASGTLSAATSAGLSLSDSTWEDGALRIDLNVRAGEWVQFALPGAASDQGELALANVLDQQGSSVFISGSFTADNMALDLSHGVEIQFGDVDYTFSTGQVQHLALAGSGSNDTLQIIGSPQSDIVELRPTGSTISNANLAVTIDGIEQIAYNGGGGGGDRVYLYDSDGDDTLRAWPRKAELVGVGYRFDLQDVDRIFIHATGGGQDYAYLYDSAGDDRLSVRPQFSSIRGEDFFNYVRGFERVYAYANAGGTDEADLYDSAGNDRFATSGVSASIVGPGFSSFTRSFEQVNASSTMGGNDLATLYGADQQTRWQQGSDYVSFLDHGWSREARGFDSVETYTAGQSHSLASGQASSQAMASPPLTSDALEPLANASQQIASNSPDPAHAATPPLEVYAFAPEIHATTVPGTEHNAPDSAERLLQEVHGLRDWISQTPTEQEALLATLSLPEEAVWNDPELEQELLDEIFRQHEELF
ncbi:Intracellular serine protease [Aureliella helgolandensis]|uniref:Intracellular serine protease n=2 Tax=Aureliella helgolandensis TaxID=2527968 RepID=A0A518G3J5_9BACT|nr:Intracellular serine protease [Aureliella helgolandensis]